MNFCQFFNTPPKLVPTPQLASEIIIGLCFLFECQRNFEVRSEQHKKTNIMVGLCSIVFDPTTEDRPEFSTVLEHALNVNHNDFWPIFLLLCTKALKNIIKDMKKNQT